MSDKSLAKEIRRILVLGFGLLLLASSVNASILGSDGRSILGSDGRSILGSDGHAQEGAVTRRSRQKLARARIAQDDLPGGADQHPVGARHWPQGDRALRSGGHASQQLA